MARRFMYPNHPSPGDAVAVLSPSGRSASRFPVPFDLGLARLRDDFGLVPVEYPTTRAAQASSADRAKDIQAAFADPGIMAVISAIGGDDELKVLPHLDPDFLAANPKPFFGYSGNTNLHLFLWNLGLVSYHGGAIMGGGWRDPPIFTCAPAGTCSVTISMTGPILFLETSEELPSADYVYRVLMCMGERGLLQRFAAILWARPKAWSLDQPNPPAEKAQYTRGQREAVLNAIGEYRPDVPVVFGVDFGHTDPQLVIPSGGDVTVDASRREIYVTY